MNTKQKEYTRWRQFLAWVGFITLLLVFPAAITLCVWASSYVNTAIAESAKHAEAAIETCRKSGGEPIIRPGIPDIVECDYDVSK